MLFDIDKVIYFLAKQIAERRLTVLFQLVFPAFSYTTNTSGTLGSVKGLNF
jgi:hypothetical protein